MHPTQNCKPMGEYFFCHVIFIVGIDIAGKPAV